MELLPLLLVLAASLLLAGCTSQEELPAAASPSPSFAQVATIGHMPSQEPFAASPSPWAAVVPARAKSKEEFVSGCGMLSTGQQRFLCLQKAAVAYGDYQLCYEQENLHQTQLCQAAVRSDAAKCSQILNASVRSACLAIVGINTGDEAVCGKIPDAEPYYKLDCLYNVAAASGDARICSRYFSGGTLSGYPRSQCEALAGKNPDKCGEISSPIERDKCYALVAIAAKDKGICNRITEAVSFSSCASSYEIFMREFLQGDQLP